MRVFLLACGLAVGQGWVHSWRPRRRSAPTSAHAARRRPIRPQRPSSEQQKRQEEEENLAQQQAEERFLEALKDPTLLSELCLEQMDWSAETQRALTEVLRLQRLTEVQARCYGPLLEGRSASVTAKTGTGKTLAFLLPMVERLAKQRKVPDTVSALVIVPTRELAQQIAHQAEELLRFHRLSVKAVFGGTSMARDASLFRRQVPDILVATPGRLLDHLQETRWRGRKFSSLLDHLAVVVLDESDRLLQGFAKEMATIQSYLPRQRQVLLFSATPSRPALIKELLGDDYVEIDCVHGPSTAPGSPASSALNVRVQQSVVSLPSMDVYLPALLTILDDMMMNDEAAKVVVFFPTTRLVRFFAALLGGEHVWEMHSKLSQASRSRASAQFARAEKGILLTSDVSARGMDYPGVSVVVQYGAPFSTELYIHRLGRTARTGREGRGLLCLLPFEASFSSKRGKRRRALGELDVDQDVAKLLGELPPQSEDSRVDAFRRSIQNGNPAAVACAEGAYRSFVAYYAKHADASVQPATILEAASSLVLQVGLASLPVLPETLVADLAKRD